MHRRLILSDRTYVSSAKDKREAAEQVPDWTYVSSGPIKKREAAPVEKVEDWIYVDGVPQKA